jgi:hypothetical protein
MDAKGFAAIPEVRALLTFISHESSRHNRVVEAGAKEGRYGDVSVARHIGDSRIP